jgi:hypothetical protein
MTPTRLISTTVVSLIAMASFASAELLFDEAEFRVNTHTEDEQKPHSARAVGRAADGRFVVVWDSYGQEGSGGYGVQGQRYDAQGTPAGTEFQVNTHTTGYQVNPSVAVTTGGSFVVVWGSSYQDGDDWGVFGQRYDANGAAAGSEFQVNTYTTYSQGSYRRGTGVAAAADGSFVVVWHSAYQDGDGYSVHGQRFDASGAPAGSEFQINSVTTGHQRQPIVASNPAGDFLVVWESPDGSNGGIRGRRFDAAGASVGSEFQVNTYTTGYQQYAAVATAADGRFLVVWLSRSEQDIRGRHYDASGDPVGADFVVNTYTTFSQSYPAVAAAGDGSFLVAWESDADILGGVFAQRFDSSSAAVGTEFRVNTYTTQTQGDPSVAADANGRFVVVWRSRHQDGSGNGVFGQRLCRDQNADSICDEPIPDETITDEPVAANGSVTTDTEADGATPADPIETTLTSPNAGTVTIHETVISTNPPIFDITITAPNATVENPLVLEFRVDASMAASFKISKNGTPLNSECNGSPGTAVPDPCIESTTLLPDGDVLVKVYTSTASVWRLEALASACNSVPVTGCVAGAKASVQLKSNTDPAKNQLKWKLVRGGSFDFASLGDPTSTRAYTLCLYDETGTNPSLVGSVQIDPNSKWVGKDPKGFGYKDPAGAEDGVIKASLKAGAEGKTSASVAAKGVNIPMPTPISGSAFFDQDTKVTVQLVNNESPLCWSTAFSAALKNDGTQFKAKAP